MDEQRSDMPPTGFPEPPGRDPEDHTRDPHHPPQTGSRSTSEPHPSQDPEAIGWEGPKRDKLDD